MQKNEHFTMNVWVHLMNEGYLLMAGKYPELKSDYFIISDIFSIINFKPVNARRYCTHI